MKFTEQELEEMRLADAQIEEEFDELGIFALTADEVKQSRALDKIAEDTFLTDRERDKREKQRASQRRRYQRRKETSSESPEYSQELQEKLERSRKYSETRKKESAERKNAGQEVAAKKAAQKPAGKKPSKPRLPPEERAARRKESQLLYRITHREEIKARRRAYYKRTCEGRRSKINEKGREYYQAHREELRAKAKARRAENLEEAQAREREYRESHPDNFREYNRKYRAKKRAERDLRADFLQALYSEGKITAAEIWEIAKRGEILKRHVAAICGLPEEYKSWYENRMAMAQVHATVARAEAQEKKRTIKAEKARQAAYSRKWRENNPEKVSARNKEYYDVHRDEERARAMEYYWKKKADRERQAQVLEALYAEGKITGAKIWEIADMGQILKKSAAAICGPREDNPADLAGGKNKTAQKKIKDKKAKLAAQMREYRKKNPEKVSATNKKNYAEHRDERRAQMREYYARKKAERDRRTLDLEVKYAEGQISASKIWALADNGEITKKSAAAICGPRYGKRSNNGRDAGDQCSPAQTV